MVTYLKKRSANKKLNIPNENKTKNNYAYYL